MTKAKQMAVAKKRYTGKPKKTPDLIKPKTKVIPRVSKDKIGLTIRTKF